MVDWAPESATHLAINTARVTTTDPAEDAAVAGASPATVAVGFGAQCDPVDAVAGGRDV